MSPQLTAGISPRILVLFWLLLAAHTAVEALVPSTGSAHGGSTTTTSMRQAVQPHSDPTIVPDEVRAQRATAIRDKLLRNGDPKDPTPETTSHPKKKQPREQQAHPHLMEMMHVLEEHIVHQELVDPNC